jgi:hypothetical protein
MREVGERPVGVRQGANPPDNEADGGLVSNTRVNLTSDALTNRNR